MPGAGPLLRLAELRKPTAQVLDAPSYAKSAARLRAAIRDARPGPPNRPPSCMN
ncbi:MULTISPECIES: hypothetical protein [Streptomyces]|uniref:hypothetical protein n=1 Tax=Streptomyces TaxID=1883 RepID=UPI0015E1607A|nr:MULTISPECIES: hypothetical protein [unclassified Streptomyces]